MKKIYKYLVLRPSQAEEDSVLIDHLSIPGGVRVLSAVNQAYTIVLYALVDEDQIENVAMEVDVQIVGTGHPADKVDNYQFLSTVALGAGDTFMCHVFVKVNHNLKNLKSGVKT